MKNKKRKGFTLVELLVVIAILAILATVSIIGYTSFTKKANESVDEQAVTQMNTVLQANEVLKGKSINETITVLKEAGMTGEDYKPLIADRYFFWDSNDNRIVYAKYENNDYVGVFPTEYANKTYTSIGHLWISLVTTSITASKPNTFSLNGNEIKATVTNGQEFAYVFEEIKKLSGTVNATIEVDGTVDMMGAYICMNSVNNGSTITINGKNNAVIKNLTSNTTTYEIHVGTGNDGQYNGSVLFGKIEDQSNVSISDVVFDSVDIDAGETSCNIGVIAGNLQNGGSLSIQNVTIRNSTVVGGRNVGSVIGIVSDTGVSDTGGDTSLSITNLVIDNVNVKTYQGRSGKIFGYVSNNSAKLSLIGDSNSIDCKDNVTLEMIGNWTTYSSTGDDNATNKSLTTDTNHQYGYSKDSVVACGGFKFITDLDGFWNFGN